MAFQQAPMQVQKTEEFEQLKLAIERVFAAGVLERFYKKLQSRDLRVREFEKVLEQRVFEEVGPRLSQSGTAAKQYYSALPVSDQSLIREFYLERIEKVDPRLRQRFQRIYRYY